MRGVTFLDSVMCGMTAVTSYLSRDRHKYYVINKCLLVVQQKEMESVFVLVSSRRTSLFLTSCMFLYVLVCSCMAKNLFMHFLCVNFSHLLQKLAFAYVSKFYCNGLFNSKKTGLFTFLLAFFLLFRKDL